MSTIDIGAAWREMNKQGLVPTNKGQKLTFGPLSDSLEALNPDGHNALQKRINEVASQFGYAPDSFIWGAGNKQNSKFTILSEPDAGKRAQIEDALNNDSSLKSILADSKYAASQSSGPAVSEGEYYASNGYDSAHFSAETMDLYRDRVEPDWDSVSIEPIEGTEEILAGIREWRASQQKPAATEEPAAKAAAPLLDPGTPLDNAATSAVAQDILDKSARMKEELRPFFEKMNSFTRDGHNTLLQSLLERQKDIQGEKIDEYAGTPLRALYPII